MRQDAEEGTGAVWAEKNDTRATKLGKFFRNSRIDESPQLINVLKGDMSFVGPRPALYNQDDLIELRTKKGIHTIVPGITGWAQVNGRDDLPIPVKVEYDEYYLKNKSFLMDLKILWMTFTKVVKAEGVKH
jgi:O-antigen biosynthesis protein WbqP